MDPEKKASKWATYEECKEFVHPLQIKNYKHWMQFCKTATIPPNIPKNPRLVYGKSYAGDADFFGHETFISYSKLQNKVSKMGFRSAIEYTNWHRQTKPERIPALPYKVYKSEWEGWPKFLGKKARHYRPYEDALRFVHTLNFKDRTVWMRYCSSGEKPADIPTSPDRWYKTKWVGWGEWLGIKLETKIKFQQDNFTHILYLYREEGEPENVISFGMETDGITAVKELQKEEKFELVKMYRYDVRQQEKIEKIINANGESYYGQSTQFIITNVNQLMWDLMLELEIVTTY